MAYQVERSNKREKANKKKRYGHKVTGRSVFIIQSIMINRTEERKKKK